MEASAAHSPGSGTAASGPEDVLDVHNLRKVYGGRPVVENVSVRVAPREVVGLLGPNGAGKTTTFYMIAGLVPPDGGTVSMNGRDVTRLAMHRRARLGLGYLPQEESIFRKLSVEQNLLAVLETRR
ncbi:MAG: ATP-binding cassette domain-containing protein, partial [Akkermansiaceae bacterium]|nr:ATP-binding cassette domain-containing protein [Akkermansiaceae bacterium]